MTRLEQRRQRHLHTQESWRALGKVVLLLSLVALLLLPPKLPMVGAKFTSWGLSQGALRSGDSSYSLSLHLGSSMTNDSPGDPGPAFRVAEWRDGQLSLDFGTYPVGNNRNFPQVLVVHNASGWSSGLHLQLSGEVAQFIAIAEPSAWIGPRGSISLGFRLASSPTDKDGEFVGTLHIVTDRGITLGALPVRLRLAKAKSSASQATLPAPQVSAPEVALSDEGGSSATGGTPFEAEAQSSAGAEESGETNGNPGS